MVRDVACTHIIDRVVCNPPPLPCARARRAFSHGQLFVIELMAAAAARRRVGAKMTHSTSRVEHAQERELTALLSTRRKLQTDLTARRAELRQQQENHSLWQAHRANQRQLARQAKSRTAQQPTTEAADRPTQLPLLQVRGDAQSHRVAEPGFL